jgi:hypothetical protein
MSANTHGENDRRFDGGSCACASLSTSRPPTRSCPPTPTPPRLPDPSTSHLRERPVSRTTFDGRLGDRFTPTCEHDPLFCPDASMREANFAFPSQNRSVAPHPFRVMLSGRLTGSLITDARRRLLLSGPASASRARSMTVEVRCAPLATAREALVRGRRWHKLREGARARASLAVEPSGCLVTSQLVGSAAAKQSQRQMGAQG